MASHEMKLYLGERCSPLIDCGLMIAMLGAFQYEEADMLLGHLRSFVTGTNNDGSSDGSISISKSDDISSSVGPFSLYLPRYLSSHEPHVEYKKVLREV